MWRARRISICRASRDCFAGRARVASPRLRSRDDLRDPGRGGQRAESQAAAGCARVRGLRRAGGSDGRGRHLPGGQRGSRSRSHGPPAAWYRWHGGSSPAAREPADSGYTRGRGDGPGDEAGSGTGPGGRLQRVHREADQRPCLSRSGSQLPLRWAGGDRVTSDPLVLVVDDLAPNVRLLEAVLSPRGFRVATASSGEEALDVLGKQHPDLVLLDIV